jgi:hypothetical protein
MGEGRWFDSVWLRMGNGWERSGRVAWVGWVHKRIFRYPPLFCFLDLGVFLFMEAHEFGNGLWRVFMAWVHEGFGVVVHFAGMSVRVVRLSSFGPRVAT